MRSFSSLVITLTLLSVFGHSEQVRAQGRKTGGAHPTTHSTPEKSKPQTSVPVIARILGVRVGWNGQERLERRFGKGVRSIGGHPLGVETWRTRHPVGKVVTEGFEHNGEGEVLETIEWTLGKADASIPLARRLPQASGWLGTISLGMTERQIARLVRDKHLPAPTKAEGNWTWVQKGYVQLREFVVYRTWTAALGFENGKLTSLCVRCE